MFSRQNCNINVFPPILWQNLLFLTKLWHNVSPPILWQNLFSCQNCDIKCFPEKIVTWNVFIQSCDKTFFSRQNCDKKLLLPPKLWQKTSFHEKIVKKHLLPTNIVTKTSFREKIVTKTSFAHQNCDIKYFYRQNCDDNLKLGMIFFHLIRANCQQHRCSVD